MTSYYNINGVPQVFGVPIGSITAYLGKSDPGGFVLCDGVARDNTDGKYNDLYDLGVGTKSGTNYSPPDYKGMFIGGAATTTDSDIGNSGGNNNVTLSTSNLPAHDHTGTTASGGNHRHGIETKQDDWNVMDLVGSIAGGEIMVTGRSGPTPNTEERTLTPLLQIKRVAGPLSL
jgi:microcystin-dependent protein